MFFLQTYQVDDYALLFWWIATAMIAIASISVCFTQPSIPLRAVFAIVFVAQLPAFNLAWGEIHEREMSLQLHRFDPDEQEARIQDLEQENSELKYQHRMSLMFWQSISHLTGMGFALLACTSAGQRRVRIVDDAG